MTSPRETERKVRSIGFLDPPASVEETAPHTRSLLWSVVAFFALIILFIATVWYMPLWLVVVALIAITFFAKRVIQRLLTYTDQ